MRISLIEYMHAYHLYEKIAFFVVKENKGQTKVTCW